MGDAYFYKAWGGGWGVGFGVGERIRGDRLGELLNSSLFVSGNLFKFLNRLGFSLRMLRVHVWDDRGQPILQKVFIPAVMMNHSLLQKQQLLLKDALGNQLSLV